MLKVGIMQPYFMPYIGYWQLLSAVDVFVILDDVNYIKKGWINRNRILINGIEKFFILPLVKVSQNKKINELYIFQPEQSKKELWKKIGYAYGKAKEYKSASKMLEKVIFDENVKLSKYIENSIRYICKEFEMNTTILVSSELEKNNYLTGQDRIVDICKRVGGDFYINPIGGKKLYDVKLFNENGIELKFIKAENMVYEKIRLDLHENLSLIDTLFWIDREQVMDCFMKYSLVD